MALLDLLLSGKSKLGYNGNQPSFDKEIQASTLHYSYSLSDNPHLKGFPKPTSLGTSFKAGTPELYSNKPIR
jgi:hypothetical protein